MAGKVVNPRVIQRAITTPTGTLPTAPLLTVVTLGGQVTLRHVGATIPPGNLGLAGWGIEVASQRILPYGGPADYMIIDNDTIDFPTDFDVDRFITVASYNTGLFDHTFYFRFTIYDVSGIGPPGPVPLLIIG